MLKKTSATVRANGDEIKRLRKAHGLTQEELAKKSGISRRTIQSLEKSGEALPGAIFGPLADAFGVPRQQLLDGVDSPPDPTPDGFKYFDAVLHKRGSFERFDATEIHTFIKQFIEQTDIDTIVIVRLKKANSILITIVYPAYCRVPHITHSTDRLLTLLNDNKFVSLGITTIYFSTDALFDVVRWIDDPFSHLEQHRNDKRVAGDDDETYGLVRPSGWSHVSKVLAGIYPNVEFKRLRNGRVAARSAQPKHSPGLVGHRG